MWKLVKDWFNYYFRGGRSLYPDLMKRVDKLRSQKQADVLECLLVDGLCKEDNTFVQKDIVNCIHTLRRRRKKLKDNLF